MVPGERGERSRTGGGWAEMFLGVSGGGGGFLLEKGGQRERAWEEDREGWRGE